MILLIDNYDSFTHNLVHLIGGLGKKVEVVRNDALTASKAVDGRAEAIVISPGPGAPESAGICLEMIEKAAEVQMPVFGVCLGMQSIAQAFGGKIRRAERLMHGKTCGVEHDASGLFEGLPSPFTATRYHSLAADEATIPEVLAITARANDDGEIMAVAHKTLPISGVQFHPESIASEYGAEIMKNFLSQARQQAGKQIGA